MDRVRVAISTAFALQGFTFAAIVTQTPRLQDRFGLDEGDITIVLVLVSVVAGLGSVAAGELARRRTSAVALTAALLGISAGAVLVGVAPTWGLLLTAFAVYGLGLGAVDATMNMQGVRVQALRGRSLMTGFHAAWSVGGIAGAGYAALSGRYDLRVDVSLVLVGLAVLAITTRLPRHLAVDIAEVSDTAPPTADRIEVPWRPVLLFGLVICLFYAADTGTATWSSVFLDEALAASAGLVPLGYAAYQIGALVARLCGDLVVRRVRTVPVVTAGTVVGLVGYAAVVWAPAVGPAGPAVAVAGLLVVGLGLAVIAPLAFAALGGAVPASAADAAIARMNIANYVGAILGGGLIGAVAEGGGLRWAFIVPLVLVVPILVLARRFRSADRLAH